MFCTNSAYNYYRILCSAMNSPYTHCPEKISVKLVKTLKLIKRSFSMQSHLLPEHCLILMYHISLFKIIKFSCLPSQNSLKKRLFILWLCISVIIKFPGIEWFLHACLLYAWNINSFSLNKHISHVSKSEIIETLADIN